MLNEELDLLRLNKITASDANVICHTGPDADAERNELFEVKVGLRPPPDFTDHWPVQLGSFLENFALDWHQRRTGLELTERQRFVVHPVLRDISCTLDAFRPHDKAVMDCKVSSGFRTLDNIIKFYTPQLIVQQRCREAERAILLVVHGGAEPAEYEVYSTPEYENAMWDRILAFQRCVETLTPPHPQPPLVPPDQWRKVDLDTEAGLNWAEAMKAALLVWGTTKGPADINEQATAEIKLLLPADVREVVHGEFRIKRNRRGAVSISRGH